MRYAFRKKYLLVLIGLLDFLGYCVTFLPRLFFKKQLGQVRKILVVRLDHIGDVLYSSVVLENLKKQFPTAHITVLVGSWAQGVLANNPYLDRLMVYDAPWFSRQHKRIFGLRSYLRLIRHLKEEHFDLGLELRGDFRHILLMALAGVTYKVGYGITGGGFLLDRRVYYQEDAHVLEHALEVLRSIRVNITRTNPQFFIAKEDDAQARALWEAWGVVKDDTLVVLHPYAGFSSKHWLDERFCALAEELSKELAAKIAFVGSDADKERIEALRKRCSAPLFNAAGATTLGMLARLLKRADLFIGVDSGPSHLAAVMRTPSVVLYSATNRQHVWGPLGENTIVIQKDVPCGNCQKLDCRRHDCMETISVDEVVEVAVRLAKEKSSRVES